MDYRPKTHSSIGRLATDTSKIFDTLEPTIDKIVSMILYSDRDQPRLGLKEAIIRLLDVMTNSMAAQLVEPLSEVLKSSQPMTELIGKLVKV